MPACYAGLGQGWEVSHNARMFGRLATAGSGILAMALPWKFPVIPDHWFYLAMAVGGLLFLWGAGSSVAAQLGAGKLGRSGKWLPMWGVRLERRAIVPFRRLIPLREAAQRAYEKTHGLDVAAAAEVDWGGRDQEANVLGYFAYALVGKETDGITLYGKRPPSSKHEAIPWKETRQCFFSDDLNEMRFHGEKTLRYRDLAVTRRDLRKRIREIKQWSLT